MGTCILHTVLTCLFFHLTLKGINKCPLAFTLGQAYWQHCASERPSFLECGLPHITFLWKVFFSQHLSWEPTAFCFPFLMTDWLFLVHNESSLPFQESLALCSLIDCWGLVCSESDDRLLGSWVFDDRLLGSWVFWVWWYVCWDFGYGDQNLDSRPVSTFLFYFLFLLSSLFCLWDSPYVCIGPLDRVPMTRETKPTE